MFSIFSSLVNMKPGIRAEKQSTWRPNFILQFFRRKPGYLLLVGALAAAIPLGIWNAAARDASHWERSAETYAVASASISPGQEVAKSVTYVKFPAGLAPANAIQVENLEADLSVVEGLIAKSQIFEGEFLTQDRLVKMEFSLGGALAIPVRAEERPPLSAGDRVNLVATSLEPEIRSAVVVTNALVFNVDEESVSVIVAPREVQALISALISQEITLIRVS